MRLFNKIVSAFILLAIDFIIISFSYFLAYHFRNLFPISQILPFTIFSSRYYLIAFYLLIFAYEGLYTRRYPLWEELRRLSRGILIASIFVVIIFYLTRAFNISRAIFLLALLFNLILLPIARSLAKQFLIKTRFFIKNLLVIGDGAILKKELERNKYLGYRIIGEVPLSKPLISKFIMATKEPIDLVIGSNLSRESAQEIFESIEGKRMELAIIPDVTTIRASGVEIEPIETLFLMKFRYNLLQPLNRAVKKFIEYLLTIFALILFSPLLILIPIIIKLTTRGPVFYKQARIGRQGTTFQCLKFRTMKATDNRQQATGNQGEEWEKFQKIKGANPNVTPIGRILRRLSLDELPQLFNVLRGEMSLAGPRPYLPRELEKIGSYLDIITKVNPGITGLWQVSGRSELLFTERLLLDEYYVKNWSLWMDFAILLRTFGAVLKGKGAY